ncbi:MAG: GIY-YIG nuclease family protein [Gammaproteobacteria bacterium]
MKGIIYLISNPCFPDWVKIGRVESPNIAKLKARMKVLSGTNVPLPFELHYAKVVDDVIDTEKVLQKSYAHCRTNKKREFF